MKLFLKAIATLINGLILRIQLRFWLHNHTLSDLESRLIQLGCTRVKSGNTTIFTTPNRVGKIVISPDEILINPK